MPTINVGGILVSYEECTENYEKALATNGQIDSVAAELEYYLNAYSKIEDKSSSALDNDSSLYNGIMSSVAQIKTLSGSLEGSFSAMKAENLSEAKKIDDEITEANKQAAIASVGNITASTK